MSWLGVDVGARRTGVALSTSGALSQPLVLLTGAPEAQVAELVALIGQYAITTVVVGRPARHGPDHPAVRLLAALETAAQRAHPEVTVVTVDETLTTKEAERLAREAGRTVDTDLLAAQLILEQYLARSDKSYEK